MDVVAALHVDELERLDHAKAQRHVREVAVQRPTVQGELTGAVVETDTCHGALAAARSLNKRLRHQASTFLIW